MKKLYFSIILSAILFGVFSTGVFASGYGQDEPCTGAYGKNTDCDDVNPGDDSSDVVYTEVELVDTALDTNAFIAATLVLVSGAGASILKKKIA